MILAPLILGLFIMALFLSERARVMRQENDRVAHSRLMRELRKHNEPSEYDL